MNDFVSDTEPPHDNISRFAAKIDPDGGRVEMLGFEWTFPLRAFLEMTEVSISMDNNPKNYPIALYFVSGTVIAPI